MKDYLGQDIRHEDKIVVATKHGSGNAYMYTATIDVITQDCVYVLLASNGRRQKLYRGDFATRVVVVK